MTKLRCGRMYFKTCSKCKKSLSIIEFYKDSNYPDGYFCWCKTCKHIYYKIYYKENKTEYKERNKEYYASHKN